MEPAIRQFAERDSKSKQAGHWISRSALMKEPLPLRRAAPVVFSLESGEADRARTQSDSVTTTGSLTFIAIGTPFGAAGMNFQWLTASRTASPN